MKILAGVYKADAGEITFEGRRVSFSSIQAAQAEGMRSSSRS